MENPPDRENTNLFTLKEDTNENGLLNNNYLEPENIKSGPAYLFVTSDGSFDQGRLIKVSNKKMKKMGKNEKKMKKRSFDQQGRLIKVSNNRRPRSFCRFVASEGCGNCQEQPV